MKVRLWEDADWPTVEDWFHEHGGGPFAPHITQMPPLGLVVEDGEGLLAAVWAYQSLLVGVCFPEWLIARPGAPAFRILAGARLLLAKLEQCLLYDDYQVLRIVILDDRIARIAERRFGFVNIGPRPHYLMKRIGP